MRYIVRYDYINMNGGGVVTIEADSPQQAMERLEDTNHHPKSKGVKAISASRIIWSDNIKWDSVVKYVSMLDDDEYQEFLTAIDQAKREFVPPVTDETELCNACKVPMRLGHDDIWVCDNCHQVWYFRKGHYDRENRSI